jgi:hypothetical protein
MSFSIKLQRNTSPLNQMNKTLNLVGTISGTLRNETDIVNPTILIEADSLPDFNYMTIDEFNRSYFVTEIRSVRNRIWEISAHSDPLMSFKDDFLENTALISRNQSNYDLLLNDGMFKCRQNSRIGYIAFPAGLDNFNYILVVCGTSTSESS